MTTGKMRMCPAKSAQEQRETTSPNRNTVPTSAEAIAAMRKISAISQENGTSKMTLAEINAEISAVRKRRK